jgi:hypothetical protein
VSFAENPRAESADNAASNYRDFNLSVILPFNVCGENVFYKDNPSSDQAIENFWMISGSSRTFLRSWQRKGNKI